MPQAAGVAEDSLTVRMLEQHFHYIFWAPNMEVVTVLAPSHDTSARGKSSSFCIECICPARQQPWRSFPGSNVKKVVYSAGSKSGGFLLFLELNGLGLLLGPCMHER